LKGKASDVEVKADADRSYLPSAYRGDLTLAALKDEYLLPVGMISFTAAILVDQFLPPDALLSFVIGVLSGISIVLNIAGIMRIRHLEARKHRNGR